MSRSMLDGIAAIAQAAAMDTALALPIVAAWLVAGAAIVFGLRWWDTAARRKLMAAFANDADLVVVTAAGGRLELHTRDPHLTARLWPENRRQRTASEGTWQIEVPALRLALHTTLSLSFEGYAGAYRDKLGLTDIQVGDDVFDKRFTIRGSHADVIRVVLGHDAVRAAITRLFEDSLGIERFKVDDDGLVVIVQRRSLDPQTARDLLHKVHAIAVLLDSGIPDDAPVRRLEAVNVDTIAVASDTGVPVVIKR